MRYHVVTSLCLATACLIAASVESKGQVQDRPASFVISNEVVAKNPGRYTATFSEGPVNNWLNIGYEPFAYRTKLHVRGNSSNELIVERSEIDGYNSYKSGMYDGATVRVYRPRNGKLEWVRTDTIKEHDASGWNTVNGYGSKLIPPSETSAEFVLPTWWRQGADQWVSIRTVNKSGHVSPAAPAVKVTVPNNVKKQTEPKLANLVAPPKAQDDKDDPQVAAPSGVKVNVDAETRVFTASWNHASQADVAGYQLLISDYAPQDQKGYHLYLKQSLTDPEKMLREDDMVFLDHELVSIDRKDFYSNRIYDAFAGKTPSIYPFDNHSERGDWALVKHPEPLPAEFYDHGQTCLEMTVKDDKPAEIRQYNFGHLQQSYYKVLDPAKTYIVEFWARQQGIADPSATFQFRQSRYNGKDKVAADFKIDTVWKKYSAELKVPFILDKNTSIGEMVLSFKGPGKIWVDNVRVYEKGTPFMDFSDEEYAELKYSDLEALRTHATIKTKRGYTMQMLTNAPGATSPGLSPHTLESLLTICKKGGVNPWLQIEMCMNESEWQGFVEYFAAPYDPAKDSPQSKPWAYKRYMQGQRKPWADEFPKIYFEISNETWNPMFSPWNFLGRNMKDQVTGKNYNSGALYGLLQEYVIETMKKSPYWSPELNQKMAFVIGGWSIQPSDSGYGQQAALLSPSSKYVTIAAYNGGWDEKESPAEPTDEFRFKTLAQTVQAAIPRADELQKWCLSKNDQFIAGTYEAGPGYNLNGLNGVKMTSAQVEAESRVMKSLTGGTATLDSFLARGQRGFALQNFFTYSRNRYYWTSHAPLTSGGQAYPAWKALVLYNREGQGDFLKINTESVPTADLPAPQKGSRKSVKDAPMVACYATREADRYNVFVLSRRIDAATPVSLKLPFKSAQTVTLFKMAGDPAAHNLDADNVKIETQSASADISADGRFVLEGGVPPAATYLLVFKGTQ